MTNTKDDPQALQIDLHLTIRRLLAEADKVRAIQERLIAVAKQCMEREVVRHAK